MNQRIDAIVVGGGLAGLCAAYGLAKAGIEVLVLERGDYPGSKNVSGGRLYLEPIRSIFPELWEEAPFERCVRKERLSLLGSKSSITLELDSEQIKDSSYTLLRSKFDKWLAQKVEAQGGLIIPQKKVTGLVKEKDWIKGVVVEGEEKLGSNVVLLADGVLSPLGREADLKEEITPNRVAVGVKEVIQISEEEIDKRFNLKDNEGIAHLFVGEVTEGAFGGGFLYTNRDTISLGIVVGLEAFANSKGIAEVPRLLENFKSRKEIYPLIEGGELVEYSAHLIPEGAFALTKRLYGNGVLLLGDAAGFALNHGITVRGMDFAIASGFFASEVVKEAKKRNDFSINTLSLYESFLKNSFVLKDMYNFKNSSEILSSISRLYNYYPQLLSELLKDMFFVPAGGKEKLWKTFCRYSKKLLCDFQTYKDLWKLRGL